MSGATVIDNIPVGAVVVTYFPDTGLAARLAAIGGEFERVIVVDNSADPAVEGSLRKACGESGFELLANPVNLGLAGALNRGFGAHAAAGLQWAVAFDQDSTPAEGFGSALAAAATRPPRPAVVGANWTDDAHPDRPSLHLRCHARVPLLFRRTAAGRDLDDVTCVIASGSLFALAPWSELKGFDEDLFLDLVDADYCVRAARLGWPIRVAAAARLRHRRGVKQPVRIAGCTFFPAFMSPLRLQYLFRNRIQLLARHAVFAPHMATFECVYAAKILTEIILFEDQKLAKLAACIRGTSAGIAGRKGAIRAPWR